MTNEGIAVKLTKHAKLKIKQRNIALDVIKKVILTPELTGTDKLDKS